MNENAVPLRRWAIYVGLAALTLAIGYWQIETPHASSTAPAATRVTMAREPSVPSPAAGARQRGEEPELREISPLQLSDPSRFPVVIQQASRPSTTAQAAIPRAEPTPLTRQLVAGLTNLDLSHGPIAKELAEQWKQGLQALTSQGAVAVPAIREFLEQNLELNFASVSGAELLGQSSLRSALINALQQIGGPEATAAMLQTLQTTTLPAEIALLAMNLEQVGPGQYRQETLNAVNEVLGMAAKGQLPGSDVGALFQVLQTYGDTSAVPALEKLQPQWRYYATMALAALPGSDGIPALVRQVQDPAAGGGRPDFALQMLAQAAAQFSAAGAALLEQARLNQIPDSAWRRIAMGLAGDQYQIGLPSSDSGPNAPVNPGLKSFHIELGNQNFCSLPLSDRASPDEIEKRRALIDQLLAVSSNPAAIQALQNARALLPMGQ